MGTPFPIEHHPATPFQPVPRVVLHAAADTEAALHRSERRDNATSTSVWAVLILAHAVVALALVPRLMAYVSANVPADIASGVGDPVLLDRALRIGAYLSVPGYALVVLVFALTARSAERHLFGAAKAIGRRTRIGAFGLLLALISLPVQASAFMSTSFRGTPTHYTYVAVALMVVLLVFAGQLRALARRQRLIVVAGLVAFALAMSAGTVAPS